MDRRGWLDVYRWERWTGQQLPAFAAGDALGEGQIKPALVPGQTQPPPLLSEADLLSKMDKHGIGTDAGGRVDARRASRHRILSR